MPPNHLDQGIQKQYEVLIPQLAPNFLHKEKVEKVKIEQEVKKNKCVFRTSTTTTQPETMSKRTIYPAKSEYEWFRF